jgi:hypothetical protein
MLRVTSGVYRWCQCDHDIVDVVVDSGFIYFKPKAAAAD